MAASYICDGCGKPVEAPKTVGHVLKRDYCEACEPQAQKFVDAEEALRKKLAEQFNAERDTLIAAASAGGFKLPDIPNAG